MGAPHDERVQLADAGEVFGRVRQLVQHVTHGIEACALLAVAFDHRPGRVGRVGIAEHGFLGARVVVPLVERCGVDGAELPLLERVRLTLLEAAALLFLADREPEFDHMHATAHQVALKLWGLAHELGVFGVRAKAHHPLHTGAVVPAAVKHHDLALRGQVLHIALEVPLATLGFSGLLQRHHTRTAGVQVLHEALDGAALACSIATLKQDHHALPSLLDPGLQLEQFDLQTKLLTLVGGAAQQVAVRVCAPAPIPGQLLVRVHAVVRLFIATVHVLAQGFAQRVQVILRSPRQQGPQAVNALLGGLRGVVAAQQRQHGRRLLPICRLHRLLRHMPRQRGGLQTGRDIATGHGAPRTHGSLDRCRCPAAPGRRGRLDAIKRADRSGGRNRSAALCHGEVSGWARPRSQLVLQARPSKAVFWHPQ